VRALAVIAIDVLSEQGASVAEVSIPMVREAPGIISVILGKEALAVHERQLSEEPSGYGKDVLDRLLDNRQFSHQDYTRARQNQALLTAQVDAAMRQYDVLIGPTMPIAAPAFAQEVELIGARSYPLVQLFALFTRLHSLTGFPAITIPCGYCASGLPAGLQISGRSQDEATLLQVAQAYQRAAAPDQHALPRLRRYLDTQISLGDRRAH
jgi:aspartyl-tRNA(Asn)/glutamyl-tRNA(Gln) amidotransferase subunit A